MKALETEISEADKYADTRGATKLREQLIDKKAELEAQRTVCARAEAMGLRSNAESRRRFAEAKAGDFASTSSSILKALMTPIRAAGSLVGGGGTGGTGGTGGGSEDGSDDESADGKAATAQPGDAKPGDAHAAGAASFLDAPLLGGAAGEAPRRRRTSMAEAGADKPLDGVVVTYHLAYCSKSMIKGLDLMRALEELNKSNSYRDWLYACAQFFSPTLAMTYADVNNNIAFQTTGRVPTRQAPPGAELLPIPGWDSKNDW